MHTVPVFQLVEDAIATNDDEVVLLSIDTEGSHVWVSDDHPVVAFKTLQLGLNVTERATD